MPVLSLWQILVNSMEWSMLLNISRKRMVSRAFSVDLELSGPVLDRMHLFNSQPGNNWDIWLVSNRSKHSKWPWKWCWKDYSCKDSKAKYNSLFYTLSTKNAIQKSFNKILKLTKLILNQWYSMASHQCWHSGKDRLKLAWSEMIVCTGLWSLISAFVFLIFCKCTSKSAKLKLS